MNAENQVKILEAGGIEAVIAAMGNYEGRHVQENSGVRQIALIKHVVSDAPPAACCSSSMQWCLCVCVSLLTLDL